MKKHTKDRIFALGSIALALYLGHESFGYPSESAFFPRVLSVLLGLLGLLFFLRLTLKNKKVGMHEDSRRIPEAVSFQTEFATIKSAGQVFGSIISYGLIVALINYEAATVLFLATMMLLLGFKRTAWTAGISLGLTALLYSIFFKLLGVSRPESLFFI